MDLSESHSNFIFISTFVKFKLSELRTYNVRNNIIAVNIGAMQPSAQAESLIYQNQFCHVFCLNLFAAENAGQFDMLLHAYDISSGVSASLRQWMA